MEADLFHKVSFDTSRMVTQKYSTSFSIGVHCLNRSLRNAIYSIYGFVRLADEIVDSFHTYNKDNLLDKYEKTYYEAVQDGISLNPIINSFLLTVKEYNIDDQLIQAFLHSMKSDLTHQQFDNNSISDYIYGSAEVVGLMCLKVFVKGDDLLYHELTPYAKKLGAAFQKINFLRDLQHDTENLKRDYFPILKDNPFNEETKRIILEDIYTDYHRAMIGIKKLPNDCKLGVYIAYLYYWKLTKKIEHTKAEQLMQKRIRVSAIMKLVLLLKGFITLKINYNYVNLSEQ